MDISVVHTVNTIALVRGRLCAHRRSMQSIAMSSNCVFFLFNSIWMLFFYLVQLLHSENFAAPFKMNVANVVMRIEKKFKWRFSAFLWFILDVPVGGNIKMHFVREIKLKNRCILTLREAWSEMRRISDVGVNIALHLLYVCAFFLIDVLIFSLFIWFYSLHWFPCYGILIWFQSMKAKRGHHGETKGNLFNINNVGQLKTTANETINIKKCRIEMVHAFSFQGKRIASGSLSLPFFFLLFIASKLIFIHIFNCLIAY